MTLLSSSINKTKHFSSPCIIFASFNRSAVVSKMPLFSKVAREGRDDTNNARTQKITTASRVVPKKTEEKRVIIDHQCGSYVHVRARRGQATDSHSLAERARRAKISERMIHLQSIVPGCDKITGKAQILDAIIDHVQSLQYQLVCLEEKLELASAVSVVLQNDNIVDTNTTLAQVPESCHPLYFARHHQEEDSGMPFWETSDEQQQRMFSNEDAQFGSSFDFDYY